MLSPLYQAEEAVAEEARRSRCPAEEVRHASGVLFPLATVVPDLPGPYLSVGAWDSVSPSCLSSKRHSPDGKRAAFPALKRLSLTLLLEAAQQATNCHNITDRLHKHYLSPLYALEFAIGFPCNLFVVLFYAFWLPSWKSINVYMFNLAISDLIFQCTLPVLSYNYMHNKALPFVGCVVTRYILHVNLYASILFMVWVDVDRLLLLWYPQRNHFLLSCKASLFISFLNWIWVTIEITPLIIFVINDLTSTNGTKCNDFASMNPPIHVLNYSLLLTTVAYVLPLLTLFLLTSKMISLLKEREHVLGTSFQRPVNILKTVTVMGLVLHMPVHLMRTMALASRSTELEDCTKVYIHAVYIITRPMAFSHSLINPVFYVLMTERFREILQDKWRKFGYLTICRRLS
ncbi:succinate receptor 1-like [Clarias gariepinus]|uniref:succinate receptor 1-like n=1 Tax=Clarias gariepinus TaxID=13013 RepID=UPI00234C2156|nr:succinate receptor 1-like [Clarias gariepinus]